MVLKKNKSLDPSFPVRCSSQCIRNKRRQVANIAKRPFANSALSFLQADVHMFDRRMNRFGRNIGRVSAVSTPHKKTCEFRMTSHNPKSKTWTCCAAQMPGLWSDMIRPFRLNRFGWKRKNKKECIRSILFAMSCHHWATSWLARDFPFPHPMFFDKILLPDFWVRNASIHEANGPLRVACTFRP